MNLLLYYMVIDPRHWGDWEQRKGWCVLRNAAVAEMECRPKSAERTGLTDRLCDL
jgi:hypothetical protein